MSKLGAGVGPILCVCFTNHAIDSFLKNILDVESPDYIVRVGSKSSDEEIQKLGLFSKLRKRGAIWIDDLSQELHDLHGRLRQLKGLTVDTINSIEVPEQIMRDVDEGPGIADILVDICHDFKKMRQGISDQWADAEGKMATLQEENDAVLRNLASEFNVTLKSHADVPGQAEKVWKERRRVRTEWESKRDDIEKSLNDVMGKIDADYVAETPDATTKNLTAQADQLRSALNDLNATLEKQNKPQGKQSKQAKKRAKKKGKNPASTAVANEGPKVQERIKELEAEIHEITTLTKEVNDVVKRRATHLKAPPAMIDEAAVRKSTELAHTFNRNAQQIVTAQQLMEQLNRDWAIPPSKAWLKAAARPSLIAQRPTQVTAQPPPPTAQPQSHQDPLANPDDDIDRYYTLLQRQRHEESRVVDDDVAGDTDQREGVVSERQLQSDFDRTMAEAERLNLSTYHGRHRALEMMLYVQRHRVHTRMAHWIKTVRDRCAKDAAISAQEKAKVMLSHRLIGATTAGCASELEAMMLVKPKIVIVEEAAEVLETHVLACLTKNVEHLILIGDHKQLQPKVEEEQALGRQKHLSVSLMERLVRIGAPYVTLTTQRRMHPDISEFTKLYYRSAEGKGDQAVTVLDHHVTTLRPKVTGVRGNARVLFISHDGAEGTHAVHFA